VPFKNTVLTLNTGTGNQQVTGIGFRPNALYFYGIANSTTAATIASSAKRIAGAASVSSQWALAAMTVSGADPTQAKTRFTTSKCLLDIDSSGNVLWDAELVSFDEDGYTFNITTGPGSAFRVGCLVMRVPEVAVGTFILPVGPNVTVTTPGMTPSLVLANYGAAALDTGEADFKFGMSILTSSANNCVHVTSQDNVGTTHSMVTSMGTEFCDGGVEPTAGFDWRSTAVLNASGFTVTVTNPPTTAIQVGYLAIGRVQVVASALTAAPAPRQTPTVLTTFRPDAALCLSSRRIGNTTTQTDNCKFIVGVFTFPNDSYEVDSRIDTGNAAGSADGQEGTEQWYLSRSTTGDSTPELRAVLTNFNSNGFNLNWTTTSAAYTIYCVAFADIVPSQSGQATTNQLGRGSAW